MTNTATGTININTGSGGTRYIRADLRNDGTLNWNTSGSLTETGATHINRGDFNIAALKTVTVEGTSFTNAQGGTIAGRGRLDIGSVAFTNDGQVSPGFSPGILTIEGTYNQTTNGVLDIELGGLFVDDAYDRLVVDGTANLDGRLDVSLLGIFVPDPSDTFVILTAGDINGFFANAETTVMFGRGSFDVYIQTRRLHWVTIRFPSRAL